MKLYRILMMLVVLAFVFSCDRRNPFQPAESGKSQIEFYEDKIPLDGDNYIYRQAFKLNLADMDNLSFAYRLKALKDSPLPGYSTDEDGWILQVDQSVWTSTNEMSFDFESLDGKIQDLVCRVDLRIKHPDGKIEEHSFPFRSSRVIGSRISVPFLAGAEVSTGIEFSLHENYGDVYVEGMYADHFMYRLNTLDADLQITQEGEWHSSLESPDIRKIILNSHTIPALQQNEEGSFTQFEVYVVSRSGLVQAEPSSIHFQVSSGNQPVALIYPETMVGLGSYHYSVYQSQTHPHIDHISPNAYGVNTTLYPSLNRYIAVNSADFQLHLRWGYTGQYGYVLPNNHIYISDSPFDQEFNMVLNSAGINYHSRITAFWLRLDGAPFPVLPQFYITETVQDNQGNDWLRVLNLNDHCRHGVLSSLSDGLHVIELRVEDLQEVLSETVTKTIDLRAYVPEEQRSGILIVDNDPHSSNYLPDGLVDIFYTNVVPTQYGIVSELELGQVEYPQSHLNPALVQQYKAVLIHSDNSSGPTISYKSFLNTWDFYLRNQGNLILGGTQTQVDMLDQIDPAWLQTRMGISSLSGLGILSTWSPANPYFVNAIGIGGYSDIPLNISNPFDLWVGLRQGLGTVMYFDPSLDLDWIYGFGCKDVNHPTYPPSQEMYDMLSTKYVGYKYQNEGSNLVVFGFPLSSMDQDAVAASLSDILAEILSRPASPRRRS